QIDYLDNIIEAANERFQELVNGQFYLMRSDRMEARGKQSGLSIDVFDGYTGQTRDVKTLSGGEKFIASLCLALGMSDVIQNFLVILYVTKTKDVHSKAKFFIK